MVEHIDNSRKNTTIHQNLSKQDFNQLRIITNDQQQRTMNVKALKRLPESMRKQVRDIEDPESSEITVVDSIKELVTAGKESVHDVVDKLYHLYLEQMVESEEQEGFENENMV